jgi:hypothetical protein
MKSVYIPHARFHWPYCLETNYAAKVAHVDMYPITVALYLAMDPIIATLYLNELVQGPGLRIVVTACFGWLLVVRGGGGESVAKSVGWVGVVLLFQE